MTRPSYSVLAADPRFRALVVGAGYPPTMDGSALMGAWHREGFRYLAADLAAHLGALVAVVKDPADVPEILQEGAADGG
jgi:hypothetical protein